MLESSRRRHSSGHSFPRIDSPKNAGCFAEPLSGPVRLVVPTVSLCEVFRVVLRERGEDDAIRAAALMRRGREVLLTSAPALEAAPRTDRPGFFRLFSRRVLSPILPTRHSRNQTPVGERILIVLSTI